MDTEKANDLWIKFLWKETMRLRGNQMTMVRWEEVLESLSGKDHIIRAATDNDSPEKKKKVQGRRSTTRTAQSRGGSVWLRNDDRLSLFF